MRFPIFSPREFESDVFVSAAEAEGVLVGGVIASSTPLGNGGDCRWKMSAAALGAAGEFNSFGHADSRPSHCINPMSRQMTMRTQPAVESARPRRCT
jgi:hypothetical protein